MITLLLCVAIAQEPTPLDKLESTVEERGRTVDELTEQLARLEALARLEVEPAAEKAEAESEPALDTAEPTLAEADPVIAPEATIEP